MRAAWTRNLSNAETNPMSEDTTTEQPSTRDRPIVVKGARVHNLQNIDVTIPRNRLTIITGVSGSGKTSLAFDTIYAEGQRRYVESLSSYARQFLERMDKPDVDFMQGISPAMAIQQKNTTSNPRSTVGTTTEIYDYMRLLFARIGTTYSPVSGQKVQKDTPQSITNDLLSNLEEKTRFYVLFAPEMKKKKDLERELELLQEKGFTRLLLSDETMVDLTREKPDLKKHRPEDLRIIVDRLSAKDRDDVRTRITDSVELALRQGKGRCWIRIRGGEERSYSERFERDGIDFEEPSPQMFSFNNPYGACPSCEGFGSIQGIDENKVIPDPDLSIRDGAIACYNSPRFNKYLKNLIRVAARYSLPIDVPYRELPKEVRDIIWHGKDDYKGIHGFFEDVRKEFYKMHMRVFYARYRGYSICPECDGYRLRKDALYVKVDGLHIGQVTERTIGHARKFFEQIELTSYEHEVAGQILYEINKRLRYLDEVGLHYLTLDRLTNTLSGGESQRINLANALGSSLIGSLYVLDEPTIGLHPRDNDKLIGILKSLRDIGNSVLVVEHDPEMIRAGDHVLDIGPFAGQHGGQVVYSGDYDGLLASDTLTGKYLSERKQITLPDRRRIGNGHTLRLEEASEHNLKDLTVEIPLQCMVCVTGVSGSGKSTLVHHTLYAGIMQELSSYKGKVGKHRNLAGLDHISDAEMVDQSPIGRSTRSNPATYTKAFDGIRELFAQTRQARIMGFKSSHFSFNVPGGRCEACEGEGYQKIEMQFLADIELPCETCQGRQYRKEILGIKYRGKTIHDVLQMSISEALEFFSDVPAITERLQVMEDVGLDYLKLGQSATTLSGGEAQRVKLARFLSKGADRHTLYFFDEPTTGLHFEDIARLLASFNRLIDQGHSVIIIEHNLDVIKSADHVIDIGPEGGYGGGTLIAQGTPEEVAGVEESHTGRYLRPVLGI